MPRTVAERHPGRCHPHPRLPAPAQVVRARDLLRRLQDSPEDLLLVVLEARLGVRAGGRMAC